MGIFKNIFTWWEGVGFGTWLTTKTGGIAVGEDALGNVYYESKHAENGRKRRWVLYAGSNDTSRIPPDWHSWMHGTIDDVPEKTLPAPRRWEKEPTANLTGSDGAYRPAGAYGAGQKRALASGDYQAWSPENL
jgi:NADH:ubiquinone oxidoreductase subunit